MIFTILSLGVGCSKSSISTVNPAVDQGSNSQVSASSLVTSTNCVITGKVFLPGGAIPETANHNKVSNSQLKIDYSTGGTTLMSISVDSKTGQFNIVLDKTQGKATFSQVFDIDAVRYFALATCDLQVGKVVDVGTINLETLSKITGNIHIDAKNNKIDAISIGVALGSPENERSYGMIIQKSVGTPKLNTDGSIDAAYTIAIPPGSWDLTLTAQVRPSNLDPFAFTATQSITVARNSTQSGPQITGNLPNFEDSKSIKGTLSLSDGAAITSGTGEVIFDINGVQTTATVSISNGGDFSLHGPKPETTHIGFRIKQGEKTYTGSIENVSVSKSEAKAVGEIVLDPVSVMQATVRLETGSIKNFNPDRTSVTLKPRLLAKDAKPVYIFPGSAVIKNLQYDSQAKIVSLSVSIQIARPGSYTLELFPYLTQLPSGSEFSMRYFIFEKVSKDSSLGKNAILDLGVMQPKKAPEESFFPPE